MRKARFLAFLKRTNVAAALASGLAFAGPGCHQHYHYYNTDPCATGAPMPSTMRSSVNCDPQTSVVDGGTTVAEEYSPLGSTEFSTNINKIASSGADIVFSDLVGDQIVAFYKQFKEFGITAKDIPICTPITTEQEIAAMGPENAVGHYTSFNYFQSVDTPQNKSFVERYKAKYGKDAVTNAVMEAAYFQTYFLAQAIAKVKSTDADALIFEGLPGQEFQAPQGKVKIDEKNHHTWLWARIGKANEQGQFDVVWKSEDWIRPQPWVPYLYPNKTCDFTDKRVLDRVKKPWSAEKNRSGTIDL